MATTPSRIKDPKPLEVRVREAIQVREKLRELNIDTGDEQVKRLCDVLNDFVRGHGFTGTVPLDRYGRTALVKLSLRNNVKSKVVLRAYEK